MSATVEGLDELKAALRQLPKDLAEAGGDIVIEATNAAAEAIVAAYPEGPSGHLKGGVRFTVERNEFGALGTVKNTAQHAWIFELGTQARHTALGANRGAMPPGHVFVPISMVKRRKMYDDLKTMIADHPLGMEVTGDA